MSFLSDILANAFPLSYVLSEFALIRVARVARAGRSAGNAWEVQKGGNWASQSPVPGHDDRGSSLLKTSRFNINWPVRSPVARLRRRRGWCVME